MMQLKTLLQKNKNTMNAIKINNIEFNDNTDIMHGRYDFSFTMCDSQGAEILDYEGYIIESAKNSRMNDEIEWAQNTPEYWEDAEEKVLNEFYNWKLKNTLNL